MILRTLEDLILRLHTAPSSWILTSYLLSMTLIHLQLTLYRIPGQAVMLKSMITLIPTQKMRISKTTNHTKLTWAMRNLISIFKRKEWECAMVLEQMTLSMRISSESLQNFVCQFSCFATLPILRVLPFSRRAFRRGSWYSTYFFIEDWRRPLRGNLGQDHVYLPPPQYTFAQNHKSMGRVPCRLSPSGLWLLYKLLHLLCWSTWSKDALPVLQRSMQEQPWTSLEKIHIFAAHPLPCSFFQELGHDKADAISWWVYFWSRHHQGPLRQWELSMSQGRICNDWGGPSGT